jgi:DNA-binding MarR family transcriptional regulator
MANLLTRKLSNPYSMSLEKEIGQEKFRNGYHRAIINIFYTNNFLVDKMNDLLKDFDITRQQYNVLRILRGQSPNPVSINYIKERMLDRMSDASRIVERLNTKGLIERKNASEDRRTVDVSISATGLSLLEKMDQPVNDLENILMGLSDGEINQLNNLLDKIRNKHI